MKNSVIILAITTAILLVTTIYFYQKGDKVQTHEVKEVTKTVVQIDSSYKDSAAFWKKTSQHISDSLSLAIQTASSSHRTITKKVYRDSIIYVETSDEETMTALNATIKRLQDSISSLTAITTTEVEKHDSVATVAVKTEKDSVAVIAPKKSVLVPYVSAEFIPLSDKGMGGQAKLGLTAFRFVFVEAGAGYANGFSYNIGIGLKHEF
jgi:hypothetical protein